MGSHAIRAGAAPVLVFAFAFAVRCIPAPRLFGEAVPVFGTDAYYHLRRVLLLLEGAPAALFFDRYINYPHGGQPVWPPVFDGLLALVAWPFHTGGDPAAAARVEAVLAWVPPLLGAGCVVLLYLLVRRLCDATTALVSAAVLAVLSGHYWYSQIGFLDHHAAVALLSTGVLLLCTRLLGTPGASAATGAGLGVCLGLLVLVWPGGVLHVSIAEAALLLAWSAGSRREAAARLALACAVANAVAALLVAPLGLTAAWSHWSEYSPAVLSRFQPWLFAAAAVHAATCGVLWRRGFGGSRSRRLALSGAILVGLLLASLAGLPGLVAGGAEAVRWLFKQEAFQAVVAESKPLFLDGATVAEARLSRFVYAAPVAAVLFWLGRRAGPERDAAALVVLQVLALGAVTLLQRRFFNTLSVVTALLLGWALVAGFRAGRARGVPRWLAGALVAAAALWLLLPVLESYRLPLRNVVETVSGDAPTLPAGVERRRRFAAAALWLRDHSPPTSGFLEPEAVPEYGVLALWTHGHLIEYVARRPSIANNFGDDLGGTNFLASYRFLQAGEAEARDLGRRLGVRYVLIRTEQHPPAGSMVERMSRPEPDLAHARLVYDEPVALPGDPSRIRIFELVP